MIKDASAASARSGLDAAVLDELHSHLTSPLLGQRVVERILRMTRAQGVSLSREGEVLASAPEGAPAPEGGHAIKLERSGTMVTVSPASAVANPAKLLAYLLWADVALSYGDLSRQASVTGPLNTDPLTTLASREYFVQRLDAEFGEARRYCYPLTVLMLDLDAFTAVNQQQGRSLGDRVLARMGEILRERVRNSDLPARLGGAEFAVVLPHTDETGALILAERIRDAIGAVRFEGREDMPFGVTASVGVAMVRRRHETPTHLIEHVRQCVQHGRQQGGNQVCGTALLERAAPPVLSHQFRTASMEMAKALEIAMHAKDSLTGGHSRAVGVYAQLLAKSLGLHPERQEFMFFAGLLHDVGKLAIPDQVLKKEGPLDDEEWAFMKRHPVIAAQMISRLHGFSPLHDPILYHHERWDGRGYPEGIGGDLIPYEARIIAVCDAYDAMTRRRIYSRARSRDEATAELRRCSGSQFDPELIDAFLVLDLPDPMSIPLETHLA